MNRCDNRDIGDLEDGPPVHMNPIGHALSPFLKPNDMSYCISGVYVIHAYSLRVRGQQTGLISTVKTSYRSSHLQRLMKRLPHPYQYRTLETFTPRHISGVAILGICFISSLPLFTAFTHATRLISLWVTEPRPYGPGLKMNLSD